MKYKLEEVKCPVNYSDEDFFRSAQESLLKTSGGQEIAVRDFGFAGGDSLFLNSGNTRILRKSLDARKKPDLRYVFSAEVFWDEPDGQELPDSLLRMCREKKQAALRPVVVGSGPAGLFAALVLAANGYCPVLLERGKPIDARIRDIKDFWDKGILSSESNVQFGEGGAGTFSDGKLTTGIKENFNRSILETFADAGAPKEILYLARPHIGTDNLRDIVRKIRERIEFLGGEVLFETKLSGIHSFDNHLQEIDVVSKTNPHLHKIRTDSVILAIGHSARDTIRMLYESGVEMQPKPFSMGVRIEHLQKNINESQYGKQPPEIEEILPAADYKLSCHLPGGRDVYTFCMCPGGQVIAGASGEQQVVTNGMSLYARNRKNSNSALLVNITPSDFEDDSPLSGIDFQEKYEKLAFLAGGSSYKAPAQYVGKFLHTDIEKTQKTKIEKVIPTYTPGVVFTELSACLPYFVSKSLREALPAFDRKIGGFASPGAVMTGIESRSSSPVRILRDDRKMSNIRGIYPCGEGAGYAGGIVSAAADGIRCANSYIDENRK